MTLTSFYLVNASTRASEEYRTAKLNGREFWVVPFVSLVEGVLNGSKGPLFYPGSEIRRNPGMWNGIPLTYGHPTKPDGTPLGGRTPEVADKFQLGYVYNDWADATRRGGEAWFDKQWTRAKAPAVANKLERNELIELSTGLKTEDFDAPAGAKDKRGKSYRAVARNYGPDHLAVLDAQRGACSLADGCGIGVANAESLCPVCGATLDAQGDCPECGWTPGQAVSGESGSYNSESLLERMWQRVLNAFVPGLPRSQVTGKVKPLGGGSGKGDAHIAAQGGFHGFAPSDEERQLAEGLSPTVDPSWADAATWAKAKRVASDADHADDLPYVVGVYKRLGGTITQNEESCQCGGSCEKCKQEGDDVNRNQMIAFLTSNCDCWKGKAKLLENKELFDDAALNSLVANVKHVTEATNALKGAATALGVDAELALNEMPAALKKAAEDKADGGADDDEEEPDGSKKKKGDTKNAGTLNLSALTPEQVDQLSVAMFGRKAAAVQQTMNTAAKAEEADREQVISALTANMQDPAKKLAKAKELAKLSSPDLHDRYQLLVDNGLAKPKSELKPRPSVYGGRFTEDGDVVNAGEDAETLDLFTSNAYKDEKAGAAA